MIRMTEMSTRSMCRSWLERNFLFLALLIVSVLSSPHSAYTHPGKTDYRGGHKCWKSCGEWELISGEYHLHDKDWKPIRLDKKGNPLKEIRSQHVYDIPEGHAEPAQPIEQPPALPSVEKREASYPERSPLHQHGHMTTAFEESIIPFDPMLLLVTFVLLLLALMLIRRRRG